MLSGQFLKSGPNFVRFTFVRTASIPRNLQDDANKSRFRQSVVPKIVTKLEKFLTCDIP